MLTHVWHKNTFQAESCYICQAHKSKYNTQIILCKIDGHTRFNDIQRTIDDISAKVLSGVLKDLEENGFVRIKVDIGVPVVVEYELLPYAETLQDVLSALVLWGEMHREKVIGGK